jgi:MFS transporter, ACS family, D-galactonate transporter
MSIEGTLANALTGTQEPTAVRWRIFAIIFLVVIINLIDRTTLSIAMPTISKEFDLSPAMQGLLLSAFFWSYALLQVPGGWLIDRLGPRALVAGSTVLWGLFQAAAGAATGATSLLVARVGLGAAEAPLFPAGAKLAARWLGSKERGRGAVFMDSGAPLGAAFGGVIISMLILHLGSWRLAFVVAGVVTIVLGGVAWRYLRNTPAEHSGVNAAELALISDHNAGTAQQTIEVIEPIRAQSLAGLLVGRTAWAMINFGLLTWGPSYLAQARGLDLKQMGFATFAIFLCGMFGSLFAGITADALISRGYTRRAVYRWLLGISGLAILASFLALPHVADPIAAVAILSGTLFFLYWGSLYWSLPTVLAPHEKVGVIGGLMNFAGSSSGIAVPLITGGLLQLTGSYFAVLMFFAGCAGLYVLGTLMIRFPRVETVMGARS